MRYNNIICAITYNTQLTLPYTFVTSYKIRPTSTQPTSDKCTDLEHFSTKDTLL